MRSDLAKCTTERERAGGRGKCWKTKYGGKVRISPDPDDDYLNEHGGYRSSARRRQYNHKSFTDRLGALKGNLRVNLGRLWDDVYSEFCEVLDRRGISGFHIWTHLRDEVSINTFMDDGKVYEKGRRYFREREVTGFYVHPVTGILCYKAYERWRYRAPIGTPKIPVPGDEAWTYRAFEGIWFRYREVVRKTSWGSVYLEVFKRQANKKEVAWIRQQLAS